MTAGEAKGLFLLAGSWKQPNVPWTLREEEKGEKNTPTKIFTDSGRGRSKKRRKGGEKEGENVRGFRGVELLEELTGISVIKKKKKKKEAPAGVSVGRLRAFHGAVVSWKSAEAPIFPGFVPCRHKP